MKHPSRWQVLLRGIKQWWKNEPPPVEAPPPPEWLYMARDFLKEYDDLYNQRCMINRPPVGGPLLGGDYYAAQAAEAVYREGHKRSPSLESEVRTLALTVERILGHLELDAENNRRLGR